MLEHLLLVAQQVAVLFALMGVGAIVRWRRLLDQKAIEGLVNFLFYAVTPCVIIDCFQRPFAKNLLESLGVAFVVASLAHAVLIGLALLLVRHPQEDTRRPLVLASVFSNAGFMGLPLEQAILGDRGVFYGVIYVVVFNLFMWSWGLRLMCREGAAAPKEKGLARMFVNPGTIGFFLGLPLFLLSYRLPLVLGVSVHHLANLNTPLAMLVIGYSLAGAHFGKVLHEPLILLTSFLRLIVSPLIVLALLYPFRLSLDRCMILATIIAASAPVAAMVSMFAVRYERDVDTSVALVSGTTLLSILTMPPIIACILNILR